MSRRSLHLALPLLAALAACALNEAPAVSKFAGCYDNSCVSAPVVVPGVPAFASLSASSSHSCAMTPTGEAWCWGDNSLGQLGDGTDQPRGAPVRVTGGIRFSSISAGSGFTCALAVDGTALCWGSGATGQLGQLAPESCAGGRVRCSRAPLALAGFAFTAIAAGTRHACAVTTAGAAYCWGFNFLGETGSTAYGETVTAPTRVPGSSIFASIGAGDSFTCALTTAGRAYCWGSGGRGELGRPVGQCNSVAGFANLCSATPVSVNTAATFTSISVGSSHVCGLATAGTALCWGDNGQGQLGIQTFVNGGTPIAAQDGLTFSAINASGAVTCGTPVGGPSVCWGLNLFGKLGTGSRIELSTTPVRIVGERRYASFAGGLYHVCALTDAGVAYCWGSGREGQLGTGVLLP